MRKSSHLSTDPLSELLDFLEPRCELSGKLVAGGTWARRMTTLNATKFCAATAGACWYFVDGMAEPGQLQAGEILVTNGTRPLTLASAPSLIAAATNTALVQDDEGHYRLGNGDDFAMLGGAIRVDEDRQALLRNGLPALIHVRGDDDEATALRWLLEQLAGEMRSWGRPGRSAVIAGLAQLTFVQTLRAYLTQASIGDEGWLKGFGDNRLVTALCCIHSEPARNWSLEELAKHAGMSRTAFAVRFREIMGVPPLTYLTRWRMHLATREIRAGISISEAAARAGYASESAFRSAFKRVMEIAPGQYRRDAGGINAQADSAHTMDAVAYEGSW